jgi:putative phosphoesterase
MRILVISDSHGRVSEIEKAIEAHPDAKHIFFLGDCIRDIEDCPYIYPDRTFHIVSGNCDYASLYKTFDTISLNGCNIFFTHGHPFSVKNGISRLKAMAKGENINLVLYGHTHISNTEYDEGIYFVNPGSLSSPREGSRSYAVVDILPKGIMPIIIKA